MKLTVIIADPGPFIFEHEPVGHRSVSIELTEDQCRQIELKEVGNNCGKPIHEQIAMCFLES